MDDDDAPSRGAATYARALRRAGHAALPHLGVLRIDGDCPGALGQHVIRWDGAGEAGGATRHWTGTVVSELFIAGVTLRRQAILLPDGREGCRLYLTAGATRRC